MKISLLIFIILIISNALHAQPLPSERERAGHWASKGQSLMRTGQYAEAYTAFQLARGLGAPNMAAQMERAKRLNLNSIQFRALISEARLLATTDPTQSLRLLEYAREKFPDSTTILKVIGEVANQPDNWYYTLRADSIRASPKFTYLLADTDKTRLYRQRGDSLTLIHTFAEKPTLRVFSPNDDYLFVTTGKTQKGTLYALKGLKMSLQQSFTGPVLTATFSPNRNAAYGSWLLFDLAAESSLLVNLLSGQQKFLVSDRKKSPIGRPLNTGKFSPGGRYLNTPDGVWQLTQQGMTQVVKTGHEVWPHYMTYASARFSDDDRHVLFTKDGYGTSGVFLFTLMGYTFSERGDSLRYTGDRKIALSTKRAPWRPFSFDSKYLSDSDSLYFFEQGAWKPLRPVRDPNDIVFGPTYPNQHFQSRFSPDSTHLLLEAVGSYQSQLIELWRLAGAERHFVLEFSSKSEVNNDVFSADGKFLLSRNEDTDLLLQMDNVLEVHTFTKSLRPPTALDGNDYPRSSAYFSPKNNYLITYSANATDADSLWQIQRTGEHYYRLVPIRAFKTRLNPAQTRFSPDEKWLLTGGSGPQPAQLWNLTEQQVELRQALEPGMVQALFSPRGNYLLTHNQDYIWNVTNRALTRIDNFKGLNIANRWRFSPDERHLTHTTENDKHGSSGWSGLYRLRPDGLETIRIDNSRPFIYHSLPGVALPVLDTYQTGKFSPDGLQWLQSQLTIDFTNRGNPIPQPDTLWNLTPNGPTFAMRLDRFVDNYNVDGDTENKRITHSEPAALFSPDSRMLMTTENGKIRFYGRSPGTPIGLMPGPSVGGKPLWGWPLHVSAKADYWFIKPLKFYDGKPPRDDPDSYTPLFGNGTPNTPDTAQIWRRSGSDWKLMAKFSGLYEGMNQLWHNTRKQSWFSSVGNFLLLPTTKPALTTLFLLSGDNLRPVVKLNTRLLNAALLSPSDGREVGVLYTDTDQQTFLLQYGPAGSRTIPLGFGTLEYPPQSVGRSVWWTRKIDDSQQTVELLDVVAGQTLVTVPFGAVLDFALRPDGNVWVVSPAGARLIRSPDEVLRWLRTAPVAPLSESLKKTFVFL